MAGPYPLGDLIAEWVDSLNPEAEIRYRQALCREADARGYERGHAAGYVRACEDIKAAEHGIHGVMSRYRDHREVYARRWGPEGPEHFADPRPGDFPGRQVTP